MMAATRFGWALFHELSPGHLRNAEGIMKKLVVALMLAFCCLLLTPALAPASTPSLKSLAKSVATLQKQVKTLKSQLAAAKSVLALAPYVSVDHAALNGVAGPNIVFQGCNLHVRSANLEGETTGLGNLIVGWDTQPAPMPPPWRTGSNNLVVGSGNNFTSYGCFIAGGSNTVSGSYASVCGGQLNQATGGISSVDGGYNNLAGSTDDTIGGGQNITLNSGYAWQAGTYHTP
jgi:hypothetical protein